MRKNKEPRRQSAQETKNPGEIWSGRWSWTLKGDGQPFASVSSQTVGRPFASGLNTNSWTTFCFRFQHKELDNLLPQVSTAGFPGTVFVTVFRASVDSAGCLWAQSCFLGLASPHYHLLLLSILLEVADSLSWPFPVAFFGTHSPTLLDYHPALELLNHVTCQRLCADWLVLHVKFCDCNPSEMVYHTASPIHHVFTHQIIFSTDDFIVPCVHPHSCLLHLFHVYIYTTV